MYRDTQNSFKFYRESRYSFTKSQQLPFSELSFSNKITLSLLRDFIGTSLAYTLPLCNVVWIRRGRTLHDLRHAGTSDTLARTCPGLHGTFKTQNLALLNSNYYEFKSSLTSHTTTLLTVFYTVRTVQVVVVF